ncbi:MAG: hypothetical protein N3F66_04330 [Spirochaetes bacterium]|nr:hypothetical protein [Spirochaetota bacterium]
MKIRICKLLYYVLLMVYVVLFSFPAYAKPKAGFGLFRGYSSDENYFASLIRQHCINIAASLQIFDILNPDNLLQQLQHLPCKEEQCIVQFAQQAGVQIIIGGTVERGSRGYTITIKAFGFDMPYYGTQICDYKSKVEVNILDRADREASYIAEEIASQFMAMLCEKYSVPLIVHNNRVVSDYIINGRYTYYTVQTVYEGYSVLIPAGSVEVSDNVINGSVPDGCVVVKDFRKEAAYLQQFYYGRKREIVFKKGHAEDSCTLMAFTVPASATMPVIVPLFGYYANEDYHGLLLWSANVLPYVGVQVWGFMHRPSVLKREHEDISRHLMASYYFGWYMLVVGGMPSFVDAFSNQYLTQARSYKGQVPIMGSTTTEIYLALLGGGSGLFYKGHRMWGYLYFHLTNICMYGLLYNYAKPMWWDEQHNRYTTGASNTKAVYVYAGLLSLIKIMEIAHTLHIPYELSVTDEGKFVRIFPLLKINPYEKVVGISCAMYF